MSSKQLLGKKRLIVDNAVFLDLQESADGTTFGQNYVDYLGTTFLSYEGKDTVRAAVGKHWDYHTNLPETTDSFFTNNNPKPTLFFNQPVHLVECDDPEELVDVPFTQDISQPDGELTQEEIDMLTAAGIFNLPFGIYRKKMMLRCNVPLSELQNYDDVNEQKLQMFWTYLTKYGIVRENGQLLRPIIRSGEQFLDHVHEADDPFTPEELESTDPVGPAFYADYKTYYNNSYFSERYDDLTSDSRLQNALPNVYSIISILNNHALTEQTSFSLTEIINGGDDGINSFFPSGFTVGGSPKSLTLQNFLLYGFYLPSGLPVTRRAPPETFNSILKYYPLEASISLYGNHRLTDLSSGETLIKMIRANKSKEDTDMSSLYHDYIIRFLEEIGGADPTSYYTIQDAQAIHDSYIEGIEPTTKLGALEYINSNLIFSPRSIETLNAVNKYKDYFPMYFEMNFSSKKKAGLGDILREAHFSNPVATEIVGSQNIFGARQTEGSGPYQFRNNKSVNYSFVEHVEAKEYLNATNISEKIILPLYNPDNIAYTETTKKTIDFISLLYDKVSFSNDIQDLPQEDILYDSNGNPMNWISQEDPIPGAPLPYSLGTDARNYITYFKNSDEYDIYEAEWLNGVFAQAIKSEVVGIYGSSRRKYIDIVAGTQANNEDLFYLIKKFEIKSGVEKEIKNIIFPNNSQVKDIQFVDTQVKYASNATYRYEVYACRLVYGESYSYYFEDDVGAKYTYSDADAINSFGNTENLINPNTLPGEFYGGTTSHLEGDSVMLHTTFYAETRPSIQLIQDLLFSTPEIKIVDSPPVPPDVNIVPYRAKSDRIKIILQASSDMFREKMVRLTNSDINQENLMIEAQLSADRKILFSSDDRVSGFEMFKIDKRPTSYQDFFLDVANPVIQGSTVMFDDLVQPNRKYYYTFRTVDIHGHFSNPSAVYEVELIDEKGAVKPIIKTISLDPPQDYQQVKECQKYLMIKPTDKQIFFSDSEAIDSIFSSKKPVDQRRRFKVRLTSKSTGKKVDINISFGREMLPKEIELTSTQANALVDALAGISSAKTPPSGMTLAPLGKKTLSDLINE